MHYIREGHDTCASTGSSLPGKQHLLEREEIDLDPQTDTGRRGHLVTVADIDPVRTLVQGSRYVYHGVWNRESRIRQ